MVSSTYSPRPRLLALGPGVLLCDTAHLVAGDDAEAEAETRERVRLPSPHRAAWQYPTVWLGHQRRQPAAGAERVRPSVPPGGEEQHLPRHLQVDGHGGQANRREDAHHQRHRLLHQLPALQHGALPRPCSLAVPLALDQRPQHLTSGTCLHGHPSSLMPQAGRGDKPPCRLSAALSCMRRRLHSTMATSRSCTSCSPSSRSSRQTSWSRSLARSTRWSRLAPTSSGGL